MFNYIEKLKNKPAHVRQSIAVVTSGAITGIIFLGWLAIFVTTNLNQKPEDQTASVVNAASPLDLIKSQLAGGLEGAKKQASGIFSQNEDGTVSTGSYIATTSASDVTNSSDVNSQADNQSVIQVDPSADQVQNSSSSANQ